MKKVGAAFEKVWTYHKSQQLIAHKEHLTERDIKWNKAFKN